MDGSAFVWIGGIVLVLVVFALLKNNQKNVVELEKKKEETEDYFGSRKKTAPKSSKTRNVPIEATVPAWLRERWRIAEEAKTQDKHPYYFPDWYFKGNATERQLDKLKEFGVNVPSNFPKGKASDLIGLHMPADQADLQVMQCFEKPTKNVSETQGRHEVSMLFQDPANVQAWEDYKKAQREKRDSGKPTKEQKEWLKFFDVKLPRGATYRVAQDLINETEEQLMEAEDPRLEEWEELQERLEEEAFIMEELLEAFDDPEEREYLEIKKPSKTLIKKAIEELKAGGMTLEDIQDDLDKLVDKLFELKPDLRRL